MVRVKICGITNMQDALAAAVSGCDALGFVFYRRSPRYVSPAKAQRIISCLPQGVLKVGVFVNSPEKTVRRIAKACGLDMLQFHGSESPDFCKRFKGYRIIKAFRIKDKAPDPQGISRYKTYAYLFDAFSRSRPGGTGKRFSWGLLKGIRGLGRPVFLSGGLNAANVIKAISCLRPDWVDVSSWVESSPGKKDFRKIRAFTKKAKGRG